MRMTMALGIGLAVLSAACLERVETPIGVAAANNDAAEIRVLLRTGVKADDIGPNGVTPLMIAARRGALDAMNALFEAGADPNRRDRRFDWTPLMHAVHKGQAEAAEALLERGADPNLGTEGGLTPLMMAAADPDPRVVGLLLAHGANPRTVGEYGDTPLARAVSGGALSDIDRPILGGCHPETVRALLKHDPALRLPANLQGRAALMWSRLRGCSDVASLVTIDTRPAAARRRE
ncbi:MAG TPA: ankyrin repeat domain-containing protein [Vicinamibacterales bacterium]